MKDVIYKVIETDEEFSAYKEFRKDWVSIWKEQALPGEKFPYTKKEILEEAIKCYDSDEDYERVRVIN